MEDPRLSQVAILEAENQSLNKRIVELEYAVKSYVELLDELANQIRLTVGANKK